MSDLTAHYGLSTAREGRPLSLDDYKFSDRDRHLIDYLLWLGAEGHKHRGGVLAGGVDAPTPNITLLATGGTMPSGVRAFYAVTLERGGVESAGSTPVYIDTPPQVVAPLAPAAAIDHAAGTLNPGSYVYVLTAYTDFSNLETSGDHGVEVIIPFVDATNRVTLTLPVLPGGADGFNVYRQAPGGAGYGHIGTINMTGALPPTTFVDDGTLVEDCNRPLPAENTTVGTNSIGLALPEGLVLEPGDIWRVYRTLYAGEWGSSLLATVTNGSTSFVDVGGATVVGSPPSWGTTVGNPSRVMLTDLLEVDGRLPMAGVSGFPYMVEFSYEDLPIVMPGSTSWPMMFPRATVIGVALTLGRNSSPALQPLIVDVNRGRGDPIVFDSLFALPADRARILVGKQIGAQAAPTQNAELVLGDVLTVDVDQHGGGDPRTDYELTVSVLLYVYGWTAPVSHPWAP